MSRSNHPPPVCSSVLSPRALPVTQRQKVREGELLWRLLQLHTPLRQIHARLHLQAQRLRIGEPVLDQHTLMGAVRIAAEPIRRHARAQPIEQPAITLRCPRRRRIEMVAGSAVTSHHVTTSFRAYVRKSARCNALFAQFL